MKTVALSDLQKKVESIVSSAQKERIVLTRGGKPSALLIGIESYDDEDLQLAGSADFWRLIEDRRRGQSIPLSELRTRLKLPRRPGPGSKKAKSRRQRNAQ